MNQFSGFFYRSVRSAVSCSEGDLCAEGFDHLSPFNGNLLTHDNFDLVAFDDPDHCETYSGVSGCGFDDGFALFQFSHASACSIIFRAIRSLMLPVGLAPSIFANNSTAWLVLSVFILTRGVPPMVCSMFLYI